MSSDKTKEPAKEKETGKPSSPAKNKIPDYQEIRPDNPQSYYKRCCGMCGAGLAGNPCWKEDSDEIN